MGFTEKGESLIKEGRFQEAFEVLEKGFFEAGEIKAGCYLAQMYYDERITKRTPEALMKAMLLWEMTTEVPSSRHKLGVNLYGSNNPQTRQYGFQYIKEAADQGYPVAYCVLGVLNYQKKDYDTAKAMFARYTGIEKDEKALFMYAESLRQATQTNRNETIRAYETLLRQFPRASAYNRVETLLKYADLLSDTDNRKIEALKESVQLGSVKGMQRAGLILVNAPNRFTVKEVNEGVEYLKRAAQQEIDGIAASKLSELYVKGEMVPQDLRLAMNYMNQASSQGVDMSEEIGYLNAATGNYQGAVENLLKAFHRNRITDYSRLLSVLQEIVGQQAIAINDLAAILREMASRDDSKKLENTEAYRRMLAFVYCNDNAVYGKNVDEAIRLLEHYSDAQTKYQIGALLLNGESATRHYYEAEPYLEQAAAMGYADAATLLGQYYRSVQHVGKAVQTLTEAYYAGSKAAAAVLSEMYARGEVTGRRDRKNEKLWAERCR